MDTGSYRIDANRLKRRRLLIALVAAHVATCAFFVAIQGGLEPLTNQKEIIGLSLCMGQAALLGIWFVFGSTRWQVRLLTCLLIVPVISLILIFGFYDQPSISDSFSSVLAGLISAIFTSVTLATVVMRRAGLKINLDRELPTDGLPARLQFTMLDLFAFTTCVALLVVGITTLRTVLDDRYEFDIVALLSLAVAAAITLAIIAALSRFHWGWRLLAITLIPGVALPLYALIDDWFFSLVLSGVAAILVASLLVVRRAGYRAYVNQRNRTSPRA